MLTDFPCPHQDKNCVEQSIWGQYVYCRRREKGCVLEKQRKLG